MKYLLDTHTLLMYDNAPNELPKRVKLVVQDRKNQIFVSDITAWEISIKCNIGKLPQAEPLLGSFRATLLVYSFERLGFNTEHALLAGTALTPHSDPFDRALVAQALLENLVLITKDSKIQQVARLKTFW